MYDYLILSAFILQTVGFALLYYQHKLNKAFLVANLIAMAVFTVQAHLEGKTLGSLIFLTNFVLLTLMMRNLVSEDNSSD